MKFAVIIVTYTSPEQTKRMIEQLNNGRFDFYIHLDKKVDIETHRCLFDVPNVYFVQDRIDIKWAGYTTVRAILSSIRQIAASGKKYAFISTISGQDYPIKSAGAIAEFLTQNVGKEFTNYNDFSDWTEAWARVDRYHLTDFTFKGKYALEKLINFLTPKRRFPLKNITLRGKETFWTLSQDCAVWVANYLDANPKLTHFLKYTWGSDEFIFQTLIMNSPFKDNVVNNNLRYINWPPKGDRPNFFVAADFDRIMAADGLFGRKFDLRVDAAIFDLLDQANNKIPV